MLPILGLWSTVPASVVRRRRDRGRPLEPRRQAPAPQTPASSAPPYPALRSTPGPAPLAMPAQDLSRGRAAPRIPGSGAADAGMALRRLVVMAGSCAIAGLTAWVLVQVLGQGRHPVLDWATIVLSTVLAGWIAFGFMTAAAGFVLVMADRRRASPADPKALRGRTAILLPAYNEDPGLILSAVQAIAEDLRRVGAEAAYDLFILSDTRDERIARDEAAGVLRLRWRMGPAPAVHYRRREKNVDRKAGNIAEWVETQGGAYDYMLVLDADSLMSAETIVEMSAAMDREPRLGLLQTVPTIVNAETPFARLQQFASRLYGPVFAVGQQWWSGAENNYYGHNAIIRTAAFAQSAGLPHLTGPKPFGGHILSHDFIEAALLRRAGWAVRSAPRLEGSFEETPPTLLDSALRDRRWCQGNLQHARILHAAGLHWVSRLHLARGIFSYLAPMVWLALLACGAVVWPAEHIARGSPTAYEVAGLFALALGLLAAPKLMAFALALASPKARAGFGGAGRLTLSLLIETGVSMLTAPVMMVMQSVAVVEVLIGRDSGWTPQNREGAELSRRDAWRAHGRHVVLGVLGALGALLVSKYFLVWASPVFLSLTLSALLSLHTSRPKAGHALRRHGLLSIPEEEAPPPVLARALVLRDAYAQEAGTRRRIAALMREAVPVYEMACPAWASEMRLVA